jgi:hypothetical protein
MTPAAFAAAVVTELDALLPAWLGVWLRPETRAVERLGQRADRVHVVALRATHALAIPVGPAPAAVPASPPTDVPAAAPFAVWDTRPGAVAYPVNAALLAQLDDEQARWLVVNTAQSLLGAAWLGGLLPPHKPQTTPPAPVRPAEAP